MAETHDDFCPVFLFRASADCELRRETLFGHNQRVITGSGHRGGDPAENGLTVMLNLAGFSMHEIFSSNDVAAKSGAQSLVSKTNSQQWDLACEVADEFDADASFLRSARAGGDQD